MTPEYAHRLEGEGPVPGTRSESASRGSQPLVQSLYILVRLLRYDEWYDGRYGWYGGHGRYGRHGLWGPRIWRSRIRGSRHGGDDAWRIWHAEELVRKAIITIVASRNSAKIRGISNSCPNNRPTRPSCPHHTRLQKETSYRSFACE